jgi:hypothetical protein
MVASLDYKCSSNSFSAIIRQCGQDMLSKISRNTIPREDETLAHSMPNNNRSLLSDFLLQRGMFSNAAFATVSAMSVRRSARGLCGLYLAIPFTIVSKSLKTILHIFSRSIRIDECFPCNRKNRIGVYRSIQLVRSATYLFLSIQTQTFSRA